MIDAGDFWAYKGLMFVNYGPVIAYSAHNGNDVLNVKLPQDLRSAELTVYILYQMERCSRLENKYFEELEA